MKKIKRIMNCLCLSLAGLLTACGGGGNNKIDIYVTPLYNSTPLQISVGKYSEKLMSESPRKMLQLADEIKSNIDEVDAVTLYVLSIRLYNLGKKDEAVYWFYTAQFRARILFSMAIGLSPSGAPAALGSFRELAGKWINGYAFGYPDKLIATLEQVIADVKDMQYIAKAYSSYNFKPESAQQAIVDEQIKGLREMIQYIADNKDDILRQRKENGVEGKY